VADLSFKHQGLEHGHVRTPLRCAHACGSKELILPRFSNPALACRATFSRPAVAGLKPRFAPVSRLRVYESLSVHKPGAADYPTLALGAGWDSGSIGSVMSLAPWLYVR